VIIVMSMTSRRTAMRRYVHNTASRWTIACIGRLPISLGIDNRLCNLAIGRRIVRSHDRREVIVNQFVLKYLYRQECWAKEDR